MRNRLVAFVHAFQVYLFCTHFQNYLLRIPHRNAIGCSNCNALLFFLSDANFVNMRECECIALNELHLNAFCVKRCFEFNMKRLFLFSLT